MYLYASYRDWDAAQAGLEEMYAMDEVRPCEVAAVQALPRSNPHSKGKRRIGVYLKDWEA